MFALLQFLCREVGVCGHRLANAHDLVVVVRREEFEPVTILHPSMVVQIVRVMSSTMKHVTRNTVQVIQQFTEVP